VLQEPTYSSIYPLGQGLVLAIGRAVFGHPWAGVLVGIAALCALCYWMLRGWTTPGWALVGGALAAIEFGPLNPWMNSYWGGGVAAAAGCLVFGAAPRVRANGRWRDGVWLGLGLGVVLLVRPFESIFLLVAVLVFVAVGVRSSGGWRAVLVAALVALPAAGLTLAHNRQVTGHWATLPEMLSQYQYGVPAAFTFQPNPTPHRALTPQQELGYRSQMSYHGNRAETISSYAARLWYRVRFCRFFFLAPLYLAIPGFLVKAREWRFAWVLMTLALFALGSNFYPFFFPHYLAAVTCLFVLMAVIGLERWGGRASVILLGLCVVHFLFWYGLNLFADEERPNAARRTLVSQRISEQSGKLLIFVRYGPGHIFQDEWVYNDADIDAARVVWARDLGFSENEKLRRYYPDRAVWLLEPDAQPPQLSRYEPAPPPPPAVVPAANPPNPPSKKAKPVLRFEEIPEAH
jgi:hypothetical protein